MKHFTRSSPSSKSTNFDTNLTPIQAAAAIALGSDSKSLPSPRNSISTRSTLYNWAKNPHFFKSVETANAQFQEQFRTQIAMLTRLALTNIQQILADTEASPSVRPKAALAVLKQDWELPNSTEFDTNSQESDPLRNELPPESPAPEQPVRSEKIGRNEPCPCGSTLKYKRCCGNSVRGNSTNFDTSSPVESTTCETNCPAD